MAARRKGADPGETLRRRAVAAAQKRAKPAEPLRYTDALKEAQWDASMPAPWEREFRRTYADELVALGSASPPARSGKSGASGAHALPRRRISATDREFA